jgi:hypothetical protein
VECFANCNRLPTSHTLSVNLPQLCGFWNDGDFCMADYLFGDFTRNKRLCHLQQVLRETQNTVYCTDELTSDPHAVTAQCAGRCKVSSRICVPNTKGNSDFSCNCFIYLMTTRTNNPLHLSHSLLVLWHSRLHYLPAIQWTLTLLHLSGTFSQATAYSVYIIWNTCSNFIANVSYPWQNFMSACCSSWSTFPPPNLWCTETYDACYTNSSSAVHLNVLQCCHNCFCYATCCSCQILWLKIHCITHAQIKK